MGRAGTSPGSGTTTPGAISAGPDQGMAGAAARLGRAGGAAGMAGVPGAAAGDGFTAPARRLDKDDADAIKRYSQENQSTMGW